MECCNNIEEIREKQNENEDIIIYTHQQNENTAVKAKPKHVRLPAKRNFPIEQYQEQPNTHNDKGTENGTNKAENNIRKKRRVSE